MMVESKGFTLIEILVAVAIIGVLFVLVVPTYNSSLSLAKKVIDKINQKQITWAIRRWQIDHNQSFVKDKDGFGDGEVFLTMRGQVFNDPSRDLSKYVSMNTFDCPGDGRGETEGFDYVTDGYEVACLTDNTVALRSDGQSFQHDFPQDVNYSHCGLDSISKTTKSPEVSEETKEPEEPEEPEKTKKEKKVKEPKVKKTKESKKTKA